VLYYAFPVLLVPMQRDLGWSRSVLVGGFTTAIIVSGLAAPFVGRFLDRRVERTLMTGGSIVASLMVVSWSRVGSPIAYYATWVVIGLAMAAVLYEPAFAVLARRTAPDHRRAITTVTLVAGLASLVFQPLTSRLAGAHGWRSCLVVLAIVVALVTVPIHAVVLAGTVPVERARAHRGRPPELAEPRFWKLTAAFALAGVASMGASVLLIAYLVDEGWHLSTAALAGGTLGLMQLPGRIAFGRVADRFHRATLTTALLTVPGVGLLLLIASAGGPLVWVAVAVLGFGQGMATLLRPVLFVDLWGIERFGSISGASATPATIARAVAPLGASVVVAATGRYWVAFGLLAVASVGAAMLSRSVLHRRHDAPAGTIPEPA